MILSGEKKKELKMLSEIGEHILKSLVREGTRKILEFPDFTGEGTQKNQESSDTDPQINRTAKSGEKVIALSYDERDSVGGESICRGEILTVRSFHLGAYTFQERPAYYDPYLGETATPWHNAKSYMLVSDTSRAAVKYLDDIEASTKDCICGIADKVQEFKPGAKVGLVVTKEKIEIVLSEYEAVVLGCVPIFEEFIKGKYDVKGFVCSLGGIALDKDIVINNNWIKGSLQRACNEVKQGVCSKYRSINLMAGEKLIEDIAYRFSIEFGRESRKICDTICNPYMEYIVQALA